MATAKKTATPKKPVRRSKPTQFLLYSYDLDFLTDVAPDGDRSIVVDAALSLLRNLSSDEMSGEIEDARARRHAASRSGTPPKKKS